VVSRMSDKEVFLRQNDKSVKLDRKQVLALEYDKNQRSYENEVQDRSSMEDVDHDVLSRYKADIGAEKLSDEQVLRSRGFLVGGHLTNASVLLFSEHPGKFMPWARVRVLRVDGTKMSTGSRMNVVKGRTFDGPLPKVIDEAKEFMSGQLREFQFLGKGGRFEVIPEYPEFAWFEGLVNAVTHRNYAFSDDYIRVTMYDDRLEILSPGRLPNIVTTKELGERIGKGLTLCARTLKGLANVRSLLTWHGSSTHDPSQYYSLSSRVAGGK
jgi:ATP-dependent DNA helicase RecG